MESKNLILHWHPDIPALLLTAIFFGGFYMLTKFRSRRNNLLFTIVILSFLILFCSPLHFMAMRTYFSAHMLVHILLLLVFGPLLVLSLTGTIHPLLSRLSRFCNRHLWLAWITGVGIMWLWHIPALFNAVMGHQSGIVILLQTGSLLLAGMLFTWPLLGPAEELHTHPLLGIIYLFTACVSCSLLGLLITFAPAGTYAYYPPNITDQQAAGLIMWVPCCFVYLSGCLWLLYRWFAESGRIKLNNSL